MIVKVGLVLGALLLCVACATGADAETKTPRRTSPLAAEINAYCNTLIERAEASIAGDDYESRATLFELLTADGAAMNGCITWAIHQERGYGQ